MAGLEEDGAVELSRHCGIRRDFVDDVVVRRARRAEDDSEEEE